MKIQNIKNLFPDIQVARYNLAAWQKLGSDNIYLIGREVVKAGAEGEPDSGMLKLFELKSDGHIAHERIIWQPNFDGLDLEDPRALEVTEENMVVGLTAVLRDKNGKPIPYPAIVRIDAHADWDAELPPFLIVSSFGPGKNVTPMDNVTFMFRPESAEYNHKLLVFSLHRQIAERLGEIQFPTDLPWAQWRMGTTLPPIWLSKEEALFIVHGISIETIDGVQKYIYSIGRAKLTYRNEQFTVKVAPEPIITPNDFLSSEGLPIVPELHPELRRVVYCCGGIINRNSQDTLALFVNVGDRSTFEVKFPLTELTADLF